MEAIIIYEGKHVSKELSPILESIRYEDELEHRASSVELVFADEELRFLSGWQPKQNDKIEISLRDDAGGVLKCGMFWLFETTSTLGSDKHVFTIKAMSGNTSVLQQRSTKGQLENMSFAAAIKQLANAAGLQVKGNAGSEMITYHIPIGERPIGAMYSLCKRYGYVLKVHDGAVSIYKYSELGKDVVATVTKESLISATITEGAIGKYSSCEVRWYSSKTKQTISGSSKSSVVQGGENAIIWQEVKDADEASDRAKSWLEQKNKEEVKINISVLGDVRLVSGVGVKLQGFGNYDTHQYLVHKATHEMDNENYTTALELRRIK